jgi:hypothetical protein
MLMKIGNAVFGFCALVWALEGLITIGVLLWTHFQMPQWFAYQMIGVVIPTFIYGQVWVRFHPEINAT